MSVCLSEREVKTRKVHHCEACGTDIAIGERSVLYSGVCCEADSVYSLRYHWDCRLAEVSVNRVLQCYGDDWSTLSEHFSESPEVCEYFLTPAALFRLFDRATQIELRRDAHIAEARLECTQQRVYPSLDRNPDQIGIPTGWEERAAFVMANKQLEKTAETMRATVALGAHAFGYRLRHDWRVEA